MVNALQYVCSNDVDVPIGSIIHTGMQNKYGGYENDCSLARITENQYVTFIYQQILCLISLLLYFSCLCFYVLSYIVNVILQEAL